jgi:transcriptional regulator GlxA family with amidase domain
MDAPKTIACLLYPDVMSLDVTGPLQVFASTNVERQRQGLPPAYRLLIVGQQPGAIATSAGFQLVAERAWADIDVAQIDTLLIPGGLGGAGPVPKSRVVSLAAHRRAAGTPLGLDLLRRPDPGRGRFARWPPRHHPLGRCRSPAPKLPRRRSARRSAAHL